MQDSNQVNLVFCKQGQRFNNSFNCIKWESNLTSTKRSLLSERRWPTDWLKEVWLTFGWVNLLAQSSRLVRLGVKRQWKMTIEIRNLWIMKSLEKRKEKNHRIGPLGRFDIVVAMSVCCCCLSPFHVLDFEAYFAPTSQSRMSNNFWDLESLGKSAGKKCSQNWTFSLGSGLKSPRKESLYFADFALENMDRLETSGRRVYR